MPSQFHEQCTSEEWLSFCTAFLLIHRAVAVADGRVDDREQKLLTSLLAGNEVANTLEPRVHNRLDSSPQLAQEVLTMNDPRVRSLAEPDADLTIGMEAPRHLSALVSRTENESDSRRSARGLLFEVMHFGLRVGRASGRTFGSKLDDKEVRNWTIFGGSFGVATEELATILVMTGGR